MEIGTILNERYQLQATLGTGGMAQVFRALDTMLERPVAVKILKTDVSRDPQAQERFRQEAKAIANLTHPNIVTLHDFGYDQGALFFVMEYLPGSNLKQMIKQKGSYTPFEALPIMIQVCSGLGFAHRTNVVHCDVKPHNVIVTDDRRVKVTDFGIARVIQNTEHEEQVEEVVWGSPLYFAPEQAMGKQPSPASDVYSAGVTFYEMLTGRPPFVAKTAERLARLHIEETPADPRTYAPGIPEELSRVIIKVLSKEPSNRYRNGDQFAAVLRSIYDQTRTSNNLSSPSIKSGRVSARYNSKRDKESIFLDGINWTNFLLALLAVVLVGGLIPFWLAIVLKWVNVLR